MRPAHVYANVSDEQYHQLVDALHRQWRVATRTVMVLLSAGGMSPGCPRSRSGAVAGVRAAASPRRPTPGVLARNRRYLISNRKQQLTCWLGFSIVLGRFQAI